MNTHGFTDQLHDHARQLALRQGSNPTNSVDSIDETDGGVSEGFLDSCENYEAYCFNAQVDGRLYHVTVEDVTLKDD